MGARLVVHVHIPSRNLKAALLKFVCLSLELTGRWRKQTEAWHPCPPRLVYCGGGEGIQACARQASDLPLTTYLVPWCLVASKSQSSCLCPRVLRLQAWATMPCNYRVFIICLNICHSLYFPLALFFSFLDLLIFLFLQITFMVNLLS